MLRALRTPPHRQNADRHGEQGQQEFRKAEVATHVGVGIITFIAALSYWRTTPMPVVPASVTTMRTRGSRSAVATSVAVVAVRVSMP